MFSKRIVVGYRTMCEFQVEEVCVCCFLGFEGAENEADESGRNYIGAKKLGVLKMIAGFTSSLVSITFEYYCGVSSIPFT